MSVRLSIVQCEELMASEEFLCCPCPRWHAFAFTFAFTFAFAFAFAFAIAFAICTPGAR